MSEFTTVAKVGSILDGRGETYSVNGRMVAVFYVDGEYLAIDDVCPHMGASLGSGDRCRKCEREKYQDEEGEA